MYDAIKMNVNLIHPSIHECFFPTNRASVVASGFQIIGCLLVMIFRQPSHPALIPLFRPLVEASDNMTIIQLLEARSHPFTLQIKEDFPE